MNSLALDLSRCGLTPCVFASARVAGSQPASTLGLTNPHCGLETSWLSQKLTCSSSHPTGGTRRSSSNPPAILVGESLYSAGISYSAGICRDPGVIGGRGSLSWVAAL